MFGEQILNWLGQEDPRKLALQQLVGSTSTPALAAGTQDAAGQGAATTAPAAPPQPEAYRSPPQLVDLYTKLMDRQRKETMIDRGIGMIGASLAQEQNRASIMDAFSGGSNGTEPMDMITSIMSAQQEQNKLAQKAAQRASVPAIAAQYGLDVATAQYLFDTGKLDSVIAEAEKPDRQIVNNPDGTFHIVDKATGNIGDPLGQARPREVELVDDPITGGKVAVWKDTKERVGKNDIEGSGATNAEKELAAANRERAARGEAPLTLEQWKQIANTQTTKVASNVGPNGIDYGNPPEDSIWARNPDNSIRLDERGVPISLPVQGSKRYDDAEKARREAEAAAKGETGRDDAKDQTANIVTDDIKRAKKIISDNKDTWMPVTGLGSALSVVPGTDAYDVNQLITTVKANLGFDKLQAMREASPTGAALGPVSDFENMLLQSVAGSLDLGQGREQLEYNLDRIQRIYQNIIDGKYVTKTPDGKLVPNDEFRKELNAIDRDRAASQENISDDDLIKKWLPKG